MSKRSDPLLAGRQNLLHRLLARFRAWLRRGRRYPGHTSHDMEGF